MAKRLLAALAALTLSLTAFAFTLAEDASASPTAVAEEYVPKIVKDNPNLYTKVELSSLDKVDFTVAKYETNDENLPDIDVYLYPAEGKSVKEYAQNEAKMYGSSPFQLDPSSNVYFYYDTEMFDGKTYITLNRIFQQDSDHIYEICYYYKMTDVRLGDSGLVVSVPNGYKKGAITDEIAAKGFTDYFDYTNVVKDGTAVSSTLRAIFVGSEELEENQTLEDYVAIDQAFGASTVFTTFARNSFYKLISKDDTLFKNANVIEFVTEKDGTVYKISMIFEGNAFDLDTMIAQTIGPDTEAE